MPCLRAHGGPGSWGRWGVTHSHTRTKRLHTRSKGGNTTLEGQTAACRQTRTHTQACAGRTRLAVPCRPQQTAKVVSTDGQAVIPNSCGNPWPRTGGAACTHTPPKHARATTTTHVRRAMAKNFLEGVCVITARQWIDRCLSSLPRPAWLSVRSARLRMHNCRHNAPHTRTRTRAHACMHANSGSQGPVTPSLGSAGTS